MKQSKFLSTSSVKHRQLKKTVDKNLYESKSDGDQETPRLWILGVSPLLGSALKASLEEYGCHSIDGVFETLGDIHEVSSPPDVILIADGPYDSDDLIYLRTLAPNASLVIIATDRATKNWKSGIPEAIDCVLSADVQAKDLPLFVELAWRGYPVVSRPLLRRTEALKIGASPVEPPVLSRREQKIIACLIQGMSNKEIANNIGGSVGSVKVQLRSLMKKVNAGNRTQVAVIAVSNGWRFASSAP